MDCVVTVPKTRWSVWTAEGDGVDEPRQEEYEYHWTLRGAVPKIETGERVYIVAWGKLRGYSPLVRVESNCEEHMGDCLVREGGAVAATLPCIDCDGTGGKGPGGFVVGGVRTTFTCRACKGIGMLTIPGFRGFRYRFWERSQEMPFPLWRTP